VTFLPEACAAAREATAGPDMDAHLARCADCREALRDYEAVREALRAAPTLRFPDDALEEVWDRTVRARGVRTSHRRAAALWGGLAAAGLLGAVLLGAPHEVRDPGPTRGEVLRAAAQLDYVLRLTDRQIRRQGTRALRVVLDDEVAPALRRADPGESAE
jgi:hypothetical protein